AENRQPYTTILDTVQDLSTRMRTFHDHLQKMQSTTRSGDHTLAVILTTTTAFLKPFRWGRQRLSSKIVPPNKIFGTNDCVASKSLLCVFVNSPWRFRTYLLLENRHELRDGRCIGRIALNLLAAARAQVTTESKWYAPEKTKKKVSY